MKILSVSPLSVGSAAVYQYSDALMEECARAGIFEDGEYNLARVVGPAGNQRIWVPRNMAPCITEDRRSDGVPVTMSSSFVPRNDEQTRVIDETVQLLAQGHNFMMEAPTGFGKTWCACDIIAQVGLKTIITITKEDIEDQWAAALGKLLGVTYANKQLGLIKGDICRVAGCKVVIAYIQSIAKEDRYPPHTFNDFGLAIWDECHRVGADFFSQSAFRIPARLRLGISATPDRKDGKEEVLRAHIGPLMVKTELAPMTPRVIARKSPWKIPISRQKNAKTGQYFIGPIPHSAGKCGHITKMLSHHDGRNQMLIHFSAQAYKAGRRLLIQSDLTEHLHTLTTMLSSAGVPLTDMAFYVGGMTKAQREQAKTKQVIFATYAMTAEATDIPDRDTLIMATPKSDVRQIVGRILRFLPDKKAPLVFDVIDATSPVFSGYWNKRKAWYASVNAEVDLAA